MTWPKAYNATLHGDIGDYRMLGTQKTYRFSFPDPEPLSPPVLQLANVGFHYEGQAPLFSKVRDCV